MTIAKGLGRRRLTALSNDKQELYRKAGRHHSRLQNIEYECWVFKDALPPMEKLTALGIDPADAYFWRVIFDAETMDTL
jgi:hypothetical protein